MFLHAGIAEVVHPVTGEQLRLEATLSDDLQEFLKALDTEALESMPGLASLSLSSLPTAGECG